MANRIIRRLFQLVVAVAIFLMGILIGSTLDDRRNCCVPSIESSTKLTKYDRKLLTYEKEYLQSFSFAYNVTHLWSIRLPDDNYYRIVRLLPCRTVDYTGGPSTEPFNSCDQATLKQYSIKSALEAQKWLYDHQNPADCSNKKFAVIYQYATSGFGSTIHQILWAFGVALGEDRIAVYEKPGNWVKKPFLFETLDEISSI